jgi:hypothetical protein
MGTTTDGRPVDEASRMPLRQNCRNIPALMRRNVLRCYVRKLLISPLRCTPGKSGITEHRRRTGCDFPSVASNHTATVSWGG